MQAFNFSTWETEAGETQTTSAKGGGRGYSSVGKVLAWHEGGLAFDSWYHISQVLWLMPIISVLRGKRIKNSRSPLAT